MRVPRLRYPAVPLAASLAGPSPVALTAVTVSVTLSPDVKPSASAGGAGTVVSSTPSR